MFSKFKLPFKCTKWYTCVNTFWWIFDQLLLCVLQPLPASPTWWSICLRTTSTGRTWTTWSARACVLRRPPDFLLSSLAPWPWPDAKTVSHFSRSAKVARTARKRGQFPAWEERDRWLTSTVALIPSSISDAFLVPAEHGVPPPWEKKKQVFIWQPELLSSGILFWRLFETAWTLRLTWQSVPYSVTRRKSAL